MTLLAYHNDPAVKTKYLDRVRAHREADRIIHGTGWENGKGCAVGCTLEAYEHKRYPTELGIPEEIAHLEDVIFEGMKKGDSMLWPEQFLDAITPGADLSMVWPRFALWLLSADDSPMAGAARREDRVRLAVEGVASLYREWCDAGVRPARERWEAARAAAWEAAGAAAGEAAWEAARAAAGAAAGEAAWIKMRDRLLIELAAAPVLVPA